MPEAKQAGDAPAEDSTAERSPHALEQHNERVLRRDSLAVGVTNAATPFLPVIVARLGGSSLDVGLITVVPAVAALLLAIPIGSYLEGRADLIRWFSLSRLVAWLGYLAMAVLVATAPASLAVPAILAVWVVVAAPATIGQVAFTIVMNDAASARGRYELLGRRWGTMALSGAVSVAIIGWLLDALPAPANYAAALSTFAAAGIVAARAESRIQLLSRSASDVARLSFRRVAQVRWRELADRHRAFARYLVAHVLVAGSVRLVTPIVTLVYVRGVHASDAEIGLIVTAGSVATFVAYHGWRRVARRRGGHAVLLASTLATAAYPVLLGLAPNPFLAGVATAVGSAANAGLSLALFDELMKRVPAHRAMVFTSTDYAAANAVGIVAPVAGAILADAVGLAPALVVGGAIGLAGAALFAVEGRMLRVATPAHEPAVAG
ncbi:MAG TPA: MFS transporter [Candidatus Limnocylindrales bacterium]|nr:MFS transporter [Candidatus Limnocylindrales bacterium]